MHARLNSKISNRKSRFAINLVSHSPPKGILDLFSMGKHLGSVIIREFIEKTSLKLVVCGHIHESSGKIENLGEAVVINAGPLGMFNDLNI